MTVSPERTRRALERLRSLGESKRQGRSETMEVISSHREGDVLHASVLGVGGTYECRITLAPRRGFYCTCPDTRKARWHGPCKHLLATTRLYLSDYEG